jgi:hypothetical protein
VNISFDYIILFVSLIYGLALTHALSCIAELIQHKGTYKNSWIWWIWACWFFLLSQGFWVSVYSLWHDCENWTLFKFSFISLQASLFYFCFYLFFNRKNEIENDLEESFKKNKRIVFILIGVLFLLMFVVSPALSEGKRNFIPEVKISGLIVPVLFWSFAFIKNKIANYIFALFMLSQFLLQLLSDV